jgi:hypothetical protein
MYQIDGRDVLFDWLSREPDPEQRLLMLEWVAGLASAPYSGSRRVPGIDAPVYIALVATRQITVARFLVAEQYKTIRLINFRPLP